MVWMIATVCSSEFWILSWQTTWKMIIVKWWLFTRKSDFLPGRVKRKCIYPWNKASWKKLMLTHTHTFAVLQAVMDTCRLTLFSIQSILIVSKVKYLQARATCGRCMALLGETGIDLNNLHFLFCTAASPDTYVRTYVRACVRACIEAQRSSREQTPLEPAVSPWRVTTLCFNLLSLKMDAPPERRGRGFKQTRKTDQLVVIRPYWYWCLEVWGNISVRVHARACACPVLPN